MDDGRTAREEAERSGVDPVQELTPRDSLRQFRLLPRRKLPQLPPRGERWSGLLRPATLVTVGIVGVLVAVVWIGVATVRPSTPTTLDGVTAEASALVDQVVQTLDPAPTSDEETTTVQECPDGTADEQAVVTRVLTPATGFEPREWAASVREHFEAEGWNVGVETVGDRGGVDISLLGHALVPVAVEVDSDADGAVTVTVTSESRCTSSAA
ncbi:hypothetical protein N1031_00330 [Herbiconiux moechotypicola]|nr:hypothetical protein [Herbiconiux moechotypicola]MCS5728196.1 hypothetical protein [Herbiconiux moechotypicola]